MSERADGQGAQRHAWAAGALVCLVFFAAVFAYGRLRVRSLADRPAVQLVDLVEEEVSTDMPLEVVGVRENPIEEAGGSAGGDRIASLLTVPRIPQLSLAESGPTLFLEQLEEAESPANPAASYASVSDFLVSLSPNPRPLRPIDDRPVDVLAAMGGGRGTGIGMDGGHCLPRRSPRFRQGVQVLGGMRPVPH